MEDIVFQIISFAASTHYGLYVITTLTALGGLVTLASLITPFTKTPKDDELVGKLKAFLHRFSVIAPQEHKDPK